MISIRRPCVIASLALASFVASSRVEAGEAVETSVSRSLFFAPEFDYSDRSQAFGFLLGGRRVDDTSSHGSAGAVVRSARLKALAIFESSRLEGGLATANLSWGVHSCVPMSFESGLGSAFGYGRSIGVLELGYFIGAADSAQLGLTVYTPLATSNKPSWFQDWSASVRIPFGIGEPRKSKARTTLEEV